MQQIPNKRTVPMLDDAEEAELQARMAANPDAGERPEDELGRMRPARSVLPRAVFAALTKQGHTDGSVRRAAKRLGQGG